MTMGTILGQPSCSDATKAKVYKYTLVKCASGAKHQASTPRESRTLSVVLCAMKQDTALWRCLLNNIFIIAAVCKCFREVCVVLSTALTVTL